MNVYTNTKKSKKLIIALVILILFNFCYPKTVNAAGFGDSEQRILTGAARLFFAIFDGTIRIANRIFIGDETTTSVTAEDTGEKILLSPESIIKGKFLLMDANIFKDPSSASSSDYYDLDSTLGSKIKDGKIKLRETISGWYYSLRNLAIVALLTILLYVAIRMILSSVSSDKAKYKMMFKDWLVALCLVFVMHYVMIGVLNLSALISDSIGRTGKNSTMITTVRDNITKNINECESLIEGATSDPEENKINAIVADTFGYIIIYAGIVGFTIIFACKYIIRALTITFLALIAPITCVTYPIDKLGDGKSQAFDFWFKEFFMEVIIQPFHLLLYVVLIGASTQLAETNVIYSTLCFAIMLPAEKFIKQMFGINEKLGSPLSSFASGAAMTSLIKGAANLIKPKNGGSGSGGSNDNQEEELPPRQRGGLGDYDDGREVSDIPQRGQQEGNELDSPNDRNTPNDQEDDNNNNPPINNNNQDDNADNENEEDRDYVLDRYSEDGYHQNSDGEYFNPYTDEYDPDYDPHNDDRYNNNEMEEDQEEENQDENINTTDIEDEENEDENGQDNQEENSDVSDNEQNNEEENVNINRKPKSVSKLAEARNAVRAEMGRDIRKKYGTTNGKKIALKLAKKYGSKALNGLTRATLAAGAAGVMGMAALATGNPKAIMAAMGAGAALGNAAGRRINGVRSNINGRVGRYYQAGRKAVQKEDTARKKAKKAYLQNQKERDYVSQKLKDKNGYIPSAKEVNAEMEKRWAFREAGITDRRLIDNARELQEQKENDLLNSYTNSQKQTYNDVESKLSDNQRGDNEGIRYSDAYEQLGKGEITDDYFDSEFGEGEAAKARVHQDMESAVNKNRGLYEQQALFAASIADEYKASDFRDVKKMKELQESYARQLMEARGDDINDPKAKAYAMSIAGSAINDAARIRGLESGASIEVPEIIEPRRTQPREVNNRPVQQYEDISSSTPTEYIQNPDERAYVTEQLTQSNGSAPSEAEIDRELSGRYGYTEEGIKDKNLIDAGRAIEREKENQYLSSNYTKTQYNTYEKVNDTLQNAKKSDYSKDYQKLNNGEISESYFDSRFGKGAAKQAKLHHEMTTEVQKNKSNFQKEAILAAKIANNHKAADFKNETKMKELQEKQIKTYIEKSRAIGKTPSKEYATRVVNDAINEAARMKGVKEGAKIAGVTPPKAPRRAPSNSAQTTNKVKQTQKITPAERELKEAAKKQERYEEYKREKEQKMRNEGNEVRHASSGYRQSVRRAEEVRNNVQDE